METIQEPSFFKLSLAARTSGEHMVLMVLVTMLSVLETPFGYPKEVLALDTSPKAPHDGSPQSPEQGTIREFVFEHWRQLFMFIPLQVATKHHVVFLSVNKSLNDSSLRSPLKSLQFPRSSLEDILPSKLSHWSFIEV